MKAKKTMTERFMEKVEKTSSCWLWKGCCHERGYGYFYTGPEYSSRKMDYAHRVSLFLHKDERHDDLCVLHSCDNPKCVNPEHLSWGTQKDNMKDMSNKGRATATNQKLTQEDIELAMLMREEGVLVKDIASYFNIDRGHASRASRGLRTTYAT